MKKFRIKMTRKELEELLEEAEKTEMEVGPADAEEKGEVEFDDGDGKTDSI